MCTMLIKKICSVYEVLRENAVTMISLRKWPATNAKTIVNLSALED